ncbi:MAG: TIGR03435 family protein, partial [Acidobacteriota bacterium]
GGSAWTDSDRYDITALTPGQVQPNLDEQMSMLRSLVIDRFQLRFHRELKELPVYAIQLAAGGPRLKPSVAPADSLPELVNIIYPEANGGVHVLLPARNATIAQFAAMMQRAVLDRPVVDKTGISGTYDFDLEWTPDDNQFGGQLPRSVESTKPSLFTAVREQLGLRLEATKDQVQALIIDRFERPSEN